MDFSKVNMLSALEDYMAFSMTKYISSAISRKIYAIIVVMSFLVLLMVLAAV